MKRIGLIINPIAGMGGRVGLKGTDGPAALEQARALGATPLSGERAGVALAVLRDRLGDDLVIVTPPGPMGGDVVASLGLLAIPPSRIGRGAGGEGPVFPSRGREPALSEVEWGSLVGEQRGVPSETGQEGTRDSSASVGMTEGRVGGTREAVGMTEGRVGTTGEVGGGQGEEIRGERTTSADTQAAARAIIDAGVELLLFAGGDGTARDIFAAAGTGPPVLGIPTGVKMHSAVYATTPRAAGEAAAAFLTSANPRLRESEVMDIDEDAFREGRLSARLFGYLMVPYQRNLVQSLKSGSASGEADLTGIATDIAERMRDGALWIVGPGTTTRAIAERLGVSKTLLGVDLYSRGELVAADATEQAILRHLDGVPAHIVVTPIGGQGYLFGRGNQQLSPQVIRRVGKNNIVVVAAMAKLTGLAGARLLVDTGDPVLDEELAGYMRVVTGYRQESVQRVA